MNGQLIHFEPEKVRAVIHEWSRETEEGISHAFSEAPYAQEEPANLEHIGKAMFEGWKWSWMTDVEDDLHRALAIVEEQSGLVHQTHARNWGIRGNGHSGENVMAAEWTHKAQGGGI